MKQSELTQLYVLLNRFRTEYISTKNTEALKSFDVVDDIIDHILSNSVEEGTIDLI